eukprot:11170006-Lingulodinium_polyedra.AAC.1
MAMPVLASTPPLGSTCALPRVAFSPPYARPLLPCRMAWPSVAPRSEMRSVPGSLEWGPSWLSAPVVGNGAAAGDYGP